jgi:excisionase family DNA binding protein
MRENDRDSERVSGPVLLTSGEARRYLNVSDATLKRLEKVGAVPALRFTRDKRFRRSDLDAVVGAGVAKMAAISKRLAALSRRNKARAARSKRPKGFQAAA